LSEPFAPLHLFGRHRELDARGAQPLVVLQDVVGEERDPGGTGLRLLHLAQMHAGAGTKRAEFDPMARAIRGPLDRRIRIGRARSDVGHPEAEDVTIPADRLVPIGDDDRDRVEP